MHTLLIHPFLQSLVNQLRDISIPPLIFRHTLKEITKVLLYESLKNFPLQSKNINTWQGEKSVDVINESDIVVVSVLRAALPMHDAVIETLDDAVSGFLGIRRDETTHESHLLYDRLGACDGKMVILVDPMVATGGSLCDAIDIIKQKGATKIISLNIIASPEGIENIESKHPDVELIVAQIDKQLDANKYIIPGLGDAGDRAFNTL